MAIPVKKADQDQLLLDMVNRRHPLYECKATHWEFVGATYEGGREWFDTNIFKYLREGDKEFAERVARAYRFNHTKQVVDLVDKYLFKVDIARKVVDAPEPIQAFWKRATLTGLDIDTFVKRISTATSQYGRVWIVVDSTADFSLEGPVPTRAEEIAQDVRSYAYIATPLDVLDMSYDEMNQLNWILIRELARDDADPLTSSGEYLNRFRLWTRDDWTLYELQEIRGKKKVVQIGYGVHGLGQVPVFAADHNFSEERYCSPGLIDDIAYLDRANANYLSNLDAVIQDQTFSQLTLPAQGILPGEDAFSKLQEMGTKRVFLYNGEGGARPEYISPDAKQAELIITAIGKIINEIYHSVGLSAARTKEDNGGGVDNSSGVAKAYDFESINALLAAKATSLELVESRLCELVCLWHGLDDEAVEIRGALVRYSREFDVKSLYDEFEIAARLSLLTAPDEVRREQMRTVIDKLFPMASDELKAKFETALNDWPPPIQLDPTTGKPLAGPSPLAAASNQKVAKELAT
jgi:hypothetical protein